MASDDCKPISIAELLRKLDTFMALNHKLTEHMVNLHFENTVIKRAAEELGIDQQIKDKLDDKEWLIAQLKEFKGRLEEIRDRVEAMPIERVEVTLRDELRKDGYPVDDLPPNLRYAVAHNGRMN